MHYIDKYGPIFLIFVIIIVLFTACDDRSRSGRPQTNRPQTNLSQTDQPQPHQPESNQHQTFNPFQARLDSMEKRLRHIYSPGFGELMLNIQIHHAKLWFAGKNGHWELAAYDQSLIRSAFQKIRNYHPDNPATAATAMIDIPLDSVDAAINHKNPAAFRRSFEFLTTTCNNCHTVTHHPFNLIVIPKTEPIGNQSY